MTKPTAAAAPYAAEWASYRKKPVVVQARQLTERTEVKTPEGVMTGLPGSWIVRGVEGEEYPVKDSVFRKTYEIAWPAAVAAVDVGDTKPEDW